MEKEAALVDENSLWKKLWTCSKTDNRMKELDTA
jgi:hypothetical protein